MELLNPSSAQTMTLSRNGAIFSPSLLFLTMALRMLLAWTRTSSADSPSPWSLAHSKRLSMASEKTSLLRDTSGSVHTKAWIRNGTPALLLVTQRDGSALWTDFKVSLKRVRRRSLSLRSSEVHMKEQSAQNPT